MHKQVFSWHGSYVCSQPPRSSGPVNSLRSPEKKRPAPNPQRHSDGAPYKPPPGIPLRPTTERQQSGGAVAQSPTKVSRAPPPPAAGPGKVMGTIADLTRGRKVERAPPPQPKYVLICRQNLFFIFSILGFCQWFETSKEDFRSEIKKKCHEMSASWINPNKLHLHKKGKSWYRFLVALF